MEQVDTFLDAIRDTFSGVRQPPLTAEEVRTQLFATTRLRPGYDEEEVDAFLKEAEARLRGSCAECGTEIAEATGFCARCGAPAGGQRSDPENPSAAWVPPVKRGFGDGWPWWKNLLLVAVAFVVLFVLLLVAVALWPAAFSGGAGGGG
jgi:DivIVA domain-containing protein